MIIYFFDHYCKDTLLSYFCVEYEENVFLNLSTPCHISYLPEGVREDEGRC